MEDHLVADAATGSEEDFRQLVETYASRIYNIALRMCKNPADAEDITQEVFIKLHRSLESFKGNSAFSTFLYRVTANTCLDFLRKQKKLTIVPLYRERVDERLETVIPDDGESPEEAAERKELRRVVLRGLDRLPKDQRIVLILRDLEGLTYTEISEALGLSEGTVKSRICRAREKLRKILKGDGTFRELYESNEKKKGGDAR